MEISLQRRHTWVELKSFVLVAVFPVVRNQGEDLWRGFIGDGERVLD